MYFGENMEITWDNAKSATNIRKHGVTFEEAATVLIDPIAQTFSDDHANEDRFITIGYSSASKLLLVVWCERTPDIIRIISARRATSHERKDFEKGI